MKTIAQYTIKQMQEIMEQQAKAALHEEQYEALVKEMQEAGASFSFPGSLDFNASGDKEQFLTLFRILRKHGYDTEKEIPEKFSSFSSFFTHGEQDELLSYEQQYLSVWFCFSSTVCRMKQVGTAMVERPVYEVVCGEEED